MIDLQKQTARLHDMRADLDRRMERIEADAERAPEQDAEERAQQAENDEVLEQFGASGTRERAAIDAALTRISEGTYGYCTRCGEPIGEERLEALPATPFCRACAG